MNTSYEWSVLTLNADGDIEDVSNWPTATEAIACARSLELSGETVEIELVRDVHSETEGLVDRQWAPVCDGKLEAETTDGAPIPKRLLAEFARAQRDA